MVAVEGLPRGAGRVVTVGCGLTQDGAAGGEAPLLLDDEQRRRLGCGSKAGKQADRDQDGAMALFPDVHDWRPMRAMLRLP